MIGEAMAMAIPSAFVSASPPTSSSSPISSGTSISSSRPHLRLHHPSTQQHACVAHNQPLVPSEIFQTTILGGPLKSCQRTRELRSHRQPLVDCRGIRVLTQGARELQFCCLSFCKHTEESQEKGKESQIRKDAENQQDAGVQLVVSFIKFYKREISPFIPGGCRYVPTCSEYAILAYKKYGLLKGSILTAWRLCRCNPFGGSGFDPPRWFGET